MSAAEAALFVPGEIVVIPCFYSASAGGEVGRDAPYKLVIHSLTGRKVDWISAYPAEKEILFKAGTRFLVLDRNQRGVTTEITISEWGIP
jgi:hypothetical protein